MMSQLFALPLRALIVAAALPTPGPSGISRPAMAVPLDDHSGFTLQARIATHLIHRSAENPAGR